MTHEDSGRAAGGMVLDAYSVGVVGSDHQASNKSSMNAYDFRIHVLHSFEAIYV